MDQSMLPPGWGSVLFAIPAIAILAANFFRIDDLFSMPRRGQENRRGFCGLDEDGEPNLIDPDGRRLCAKPKTRRRQAPQIVQPLPVSLYREIDRQQTHLLSASQAPTRRRRSQIANH